MWQDVFVGFFTIRLLELGFPFNVQQKINVKRAIHGSDAANI